MVKATIKLKDGTKVEIEGSPEEIAQTKERLTASDSSQSSSAITIKKQKKGPIGLVMDLKIEGFFDSPRTMSEVRAKLEEIGHYYPLTSLSPALIRLVRNRELGRLKKEGGWVWVKR